MASFTFMARNTEAFTVQAADRFEAFRAARDLKPEALDIALLRGDGLCPACNGDGILTDDPQVLKCRSCGGLFTDRQSITAEQAMKFVAIHLPMQLNAGGDGQFFFSFELGGNGRLSGARVHGWADAKTKRVVQWG